MRSIIARLKCPELGSFLYKFIVPVLSVFFGAYITHNFEKLHYKERVRIDTALFLQNNYFELKSSFNRNIDEYLKVVNEDPEKTNIKNLNEKHFSLLRDLTHLDGLSKSIGAQARLKENISIAIRSTNDLSNLLLRSNFFSDFKNQKDYVRLERKIFSLKSPIISDFDEIIDKKIVLDRD